MRIIVNRLTTLLRRTGIGHYTHELLRCLRDLTPPGAIGEFPGRMGGSAFCAVQWLRKLRIFSERGVASELYSSTSQGQNFSQRAQAGKQALMARYFQWVNKWQTFDLYHEPNFIPMPCDLPTVATLHDLSILLHPEWHPARRVFHFERYFHQGLKRCVHFLAISEYGRQEIIKTLGIPPEKITRTYMGIRPGLAPLPGKMVGEILKGLGLPRNYLLYLGTIEPRKNVLRLLRAYCAIPENLRKLWPLVLVGGWGWNTHDVAEFMHQEARHRGVLHLGYLEEEYLPVLYNGARALVYPSLYEGFGMPPIEMMACGGAVLASTAGALVETVGSKAHLVDPEDDDGWRAALMRIVQDEDWWKSLRQGAQEVAQAYSWENCARATLRVYRSACEKEKGDRQVFC
jgi:alpha-1,3-rhamnosyl/mannosyltransferase